MSAGADLLSAARNGRRDAFDRLVAPVLPKVRGAIWRMIGHEEDGDDVLQEALLKAWRALPDFDGRAQFSTWLTSIAMRCAIDHLRGQKRWRRESQIAYAQTCRTNEDMSGEILATLGDPEFTFDAKEHIAYCFVCIGRSLPPDEQAALVLRDVMEFSGREAANVLGTTESVLRHRLAAARQSMEGRYDGLCALVSKSGICRQCTGLGNAARAVGGRVAPLPDIESFADRMEAIRKADPARRSNRKLHEVFFRRTKEIEDAGTGELIADCE